jgi:hypothetical protein
VAEEKIRLLICHTCKSVEELPDYQGNARHDHLLSFLVKAHQNPDGTGHLGALANVEKKNWDSPVVREAILARLREECGHTGLDPSFYATRDTFGEDALGCFQLHHRNIKCNEYKSERKRLTPGTAEERKAAGLPKYRATFDRYLCEFCPVHTAVTEALRFKAGLYK